MQTFATSVAFHSDREFEDLAGEFATRFMGGVRFIPADRRLSREFTRSECIEHPFMGHDISLSWSEYEPDLFRLYCTISEGLFAPDVAKATQWLNGSLRGCLANLLSKINNVVVPEVAAGAASLSADLLQGRARFYSRLTFQEVAAAASRELFCGLPFVPADNAPLRSSSLLRLMCEFVGHVITFSDEDGHGYELRIEPGHAIINDIIKIDSCPLRLIDVSEWLVMPFLGRQWISASTGSHDEHGD